MRVLPILLAIAGLVSAASADVTVLRMDGAAGFRVDAPIEPLAMDVTGTKSPAEAARKLYQDFRPRLAVVTAGTEGAFAFGPEGEIHQPAFRVAVKDTTGAGDVFHAGFGYGLLKGWEQAMTLRFAAAVAAIKCTRVGGRDGIPTPDAVQSFLIQQGTPIL